MWCRRARRWWRRWRFEKGEEGRCLLFYLVQKKHPTTPALGHPLQTKNVCAGGGGCVVLSLCVCGRRVWASSATEETKKQAATNSLCQSHFRRKPSQNPLKSNQLCLAKELKASPAKAPRYVRSSLERAPPPPAAGRRRWRRRGAWAGGAEIRRRFFSHQKNSYRARSAAPARAPVTPNGARSRAVVSSGVGVRARAAGGVVAAAGEPQKTLCRAAIPCAPPATPPPPAPRDTIPPRWRGGRVCPLRLGGVVWSGRACEPRARPRDAVCLTPPNPPFLSLQPAPACSSPSAAATACSR